MSNLSYCGLLFVFEGHSDHLQAAEGSFFSPRPTLLLCSTSRQSGVAFQPSSAASLGARIKAGGASAAPTDPASVDGHEGLGPGHLPKVTRGLHIVFIAGKISVA